MKLAEVFQIKTEQILIINVQPSGKTSSDGENYFIATLKNPITVACSYNKEIEPFITKEVLIRESATQLEWKGSKEDGFYLEGWVADYSTSQDAVLYLPETIAAWKRNNRKAGRDNEIKTLNERIKEKSKRLMEESGK